MGRQFVGEVVEDQFEGSDGEMVTITKLAYMGMWSLANPKVADVPRGNVPDDLQEQFDEEDDEDDEEWAGF